MKSFIYKIPFYQYSKTKLFAWCKQAFVLEQSTQTFKSRSQDCCLQSFVDWKNPCQTCAKDRNCFNSACIKIIAQVFGRFLNVISKVLCYLKGTSLYFEFFLYLFTVHLRNLLTNHEQGNVPPKGFKNLQKTMPCKQSVKKIWC